MSATATSEVATASFTGSRRMPVNAGTRMRPPPTPSTPARKPAATPIAINATIDSAPTGTARSVATAAPTGRSRSSSPSDVGLPKDRAAAVEHEERGRDHQPAAVDLGGRPDADCCERHARQAAPEGDPPADQTLLRVADRPGDRRRDHGGDGRTDRLERCRADRPHARGRQTPRRRPRRWPRRCPTGSPGTGRRWRFRQGSRLHSPGSASIHLLPIKASYRYSGGMDLADLELVVDDGGGRNAHPRGRATPRRPTGAHPPAGPPRARARRVALRAGPSRRPRHAGRRDASPMARADVLAVDPVPRAADARRDRRQGRPPPDRHGADVGRRRPARRCWRPTGAPIPTSTSTSPRAATPTGCWRRSRRAASTWRSTVVPEQLDPDLVLAVSRRQTFVLVVAVRSSARRARRRCPGRSLVAERLVAIRAGEGLRQLLDRVFRELDVDPDVSIETTDREMLLPLVAAGMGVTLVPDHFARRRLVDGVEARPLRPAVHRRVGAIVARGRREPSGTLTWSTDSADDWPRD